MEVQHVQNEINMLKAMIEKNKGHWTIPIINEELRFQEAKLKILLKPKKR